MKKKFGGRAIFADGAHASRFVEPWIANPGMARAVESSGLQAVPVPLACVLPPSLARVNTFYAREMRMLS
jgi:hypothetical protein